MRLATFALGALAVLPAGTATAQTATAPAIGPDAVKIRSSINLGSTSFYDGFGPSEPGLTTLTYLRWAHLTKVTDSSGNATPALVNPHIDSVAGVLQLSYAAPIEAPGGLFGFDFLLPVIGLSSGADAPGAPLRDNGVNIGDVTFGPFYQARPTISNGRPVFSWRAAFDVIAPTGGFDRSRDVNQSAGYWSINPYVAATVLPTPKWEISARFHYLYNFTTSKIANPPPIPGFVLRNGQAGQAAWVNFASSYEVFPGVRPGVNGYFLYQFQNDRANGMTLRDTRASQLYLGPGVSWEIARDNILDLNAYFPVQAHNLAVGPQLNLQYIRKF